MYTDTDRFIDAVAARAGLPDTARIEWLVRATLRALASNLDRAPAEFAAGLPGSYGDELALTPACPPFEPHELYAHIRRTMGIRQGVAIEVVQSVFAEICRCWTRRTRASIRAALPPAWASFIIDPDRTLPLRRRRPAPADARAGTLATGAPGSSRPLATSAPPVGQSHSIAAGDGSHGGRTLASAGMVDRNREP